MNVTRLIILGTRVFAEEVLDLIEDHNVSHADQPLEVTCCVENFDRVRCRLRVAGVPIRFIDDIEDLRPDHWALCALGSTKRKDFVDQVKMMGFPFVTLIHPTAHVAPSAVLREGSIIGAGVIVAARAQIGSHVILNRGAMIGHHAKVGDFVTIGPGANIAGLAELEDQVFVGMGALILDRKKICRKAVVAAGSIVTRDVPEGVLVMGSPARIRQEGLNGR